MTKARFSILSATLAASLLLQACAVIQPSNDSFSNTPLPRVVTPMFDEQLKMVGEMLVAKRNYKDLIISVEPVYLQIQDPSLPLVITDNVRVSVRNINTRIFGMKAVDVKLIPKVAPPEIVIGGGFNVSDTTEIRQKALGGDVGVGGGDYRLNGGARINSGSKKGAIGLDLYITDFGNGLGSYGSATRVRVAYEEYSDSVSASVYLGVVGINYDHSYEKKAWKSMIIQGAINLALLQSLANKYHLPSWLNLEPQVQQELQRTIRAGFERDHWKSKVFRTQVYLNRLGWKLRNIDGIKGEKTKEAIRSFQATHNLPVDGKISTDLFIKLIEEHGKMLLKNSQPA